jgi:hypothetical protein
MVVVVVVVEGSVVVVGFVVVVVGFVVVVVGLVVVVVVVVVEGGGDAVAGLAATRIPTKSEQSTFAGSESR